MTGPAVYRGAWVLPVSAPPIANGAVRVDAAGRIESVGPAREVESRGARLVELGESAILPGLVNVHAHPELTVLRGRLEGAAFPDWIGRLIELKYGMLTAEGSSASTWLGVAEAIAAGVTCLTAPDDAGFLQDAMQEARLRGVVYREVFGPDPVRAEPALRGLREKVDAMRRHQNDLVAIGISPHAPYTVSHRLFAALADYAASEDLPVCVHAAESAAEDSFIRDGLGPFAERLRARRIPVEGARMSPIAWLSETGILEARPLLVHCVRVDDDDVARIADAGASIAHCPISNAKFGHGVAPLLDFLAADIPVGLGSDSVASNNRVDTLGEARFAALVQRSVRREPDVLEPDRLLHLATLGGARALGLQDRVGSLEPGKDADLTAISLAGPHVVPVSDPVAAIVHSATVGDVRLTVVRGRVLYRDGEFSTLEWGAVLEGSSRALPT